MYAKGILKKMSLVSTGANYVNPEPSRLKSEGVETRRAPSFWDEGIVQTTNER